MKERSNSLKVSPKRDYNKMSQNFNYNEDENREYEYKRVAKKNKRDDENSLEANNQNDLKYNSYNKNFRNNTKSYQNVGEKVRTNSLQNVERSEWINNRSEINKEFQEKNKVREKYGVYSQANHAANNANGGSGSPHANASKITKADNQDTIASRLSAEQFKQQKLNILKTAYVVSKNSHNIFASLKEKKEFVKLFQENAEDLKKDCWSLERLMSYKKNQIEILKNKQARHERMYEIRMKANEEKRIVELKRIEEIKENMLKSKNRKAISLDIKKKKKKNMFEDNKVIYKNSKKESEKHAINKQWFLDEFHQMKRERVVEMKKEKRKADLVKTEYIANKHTELNLRLQEDLKDHSSKIDRLKVDLDSLVSKETQLRDKLKVINFEYQNTLEQFKTVKREKKIAKYERFDKRMLTDLQNIPDSQKSHIASDIFRYRRNSKSLSHASEQSNRRTQSPAKSQMKNNSPSPNHSILPSRAAVKSKKHAQGRVQSTGNSHSHSRPGTHNTLAQQQGRPFGYFTGEDNDTKEKSKYKIRKTKAKSLFKTSHKLALDPAFNKYNDRGQQLDHLQKLEKLNSNQNLKNANKITIDLSKKLKIELPKWIDFKNESFRSSLNANSYQSYRIKNHSKKTKSRNHDKNLKTENKGKMVVVEWNKGESYKSSGNLKINMKKHNSKWDSLIVNNSQQIFRSSHENCHDNNENIHQIKNNEKSHDKSNVFGW